MNTKNNQTEFSKESIDIYLRKLSKVYKKLSAGRMPAASRKLVENAVNLNIQELRNLYRQQTETEAENCRLLIQFEADHTGVLNSENLTEIAANLKK